MEDIEKDEIIDDDDDEELIELMGNIFSDDDDREEKVDRLVLLDQKPEKVDKPDRRTFDFEVESSGDARLTVSSTDGGTKASGELPKMEQIETELPELAREDILNVLKSVPRVGHVMAVSIVDSGFDNYHTLSTCSESDLKGIPGLGIDLASKVVERVKKEYPPKLKVEEKVEEEPLVPVEKIEEKVETGSEEQLEETKEEEAPSSEDDEVKEKPEEEVPKGDGEEKVADEGEEKETKETKEKGGMWGKIKGLFSRKKEIPSSEEKAEEKVGEKDGEKGEETVLEGTDAKETGQEEAADLLELSEEKMQGPTTPLKEDEDGEIPRIAASEITETESVSPVREFMTTLDIEKDVAEKIYAAGYRTLEELKEATPEDLVYVEGINPTLARKIYAKFH